ncbi:MAG TPA: phosphoribosyltransferase [Algoriphagus sp.]|jgi:pyrimidine operon attenuation protein/uracil phosphoribosyltransferase|uniref:Pyrimidine operon attenuation protein / uracil phosphoribosyltransferase n=1 Tax=Algoriphagus ornithinivorans TaxID=226506 RepID=A0A1I5JH27_9BACT|nr:MULTISPECIES: phosphoribosyltransferase family protein [Algoriphagus]MAL13131.1 phosphoribosyltransferase [Algoriphagus sp.]MAN87284.1 phosphoribosyltransferase [Algoriphagus sp.]QYH41070.1 phosphoribosyltransferase [Algoriphagus sp. NBT04N3]SFO72092.1 pyrimidine operon attenuation protein / uracil phosphoribosyltransferase [Algoriphagus ornithinivorans]HAD53481.1 phosphoribosyltransferase [Algoriphagus sp.]|tara:strand:+ start:820 stop:1311 length:492 start_codon:yes stop_codon:yes gene_type:complete
MSEVLNHQQIRKKITRMAYEIYERNLYSSGVVFAGISGMGLILSQLLAKELKSISNLAVEEVEIVLDKSDIAHSKVELSQSVVLSGKTLIVVDDVLNTGRTIVYAIKPFLEEDIDKMELAVLVNRAHGLFPIRPDYTGYELSTTLNEHIKVDLSEENYFVHLH